MPPTTPSIAPADARLAEAVDALAAPAPAAPRRRTSPPRRLRSEASSAPPVLVEVRRGDSVESRHRGHVVQVSADGAVIRAAGTPDVPVLLRSTVKPFALVALVESGAADDLQLTAAELAIMAASHSGEDKHVRTLQALFRRASVTPSVLRCGTAGAPADALTAARLARDGEAPSAIRHGCSGFHAASILLSAYAGWPVDGYTDPAHPSQVAVRDTVARLFGRRPAALRTSPDNCGVLTYEVPLVDLARAYLLLADPEAQAVDGARARSAPALVRIRDAMMACPDMVGGTHDRLDTELMRRRPGRLVAKAGADGLRAVGLLQGATSGGGSLGGPESLASGLAVKIEDGDLSRRAIKAVSVEVLAQIGALEQRDVEALAAFHHPTVRTPSGYDAATAWPAFELAPLAELT